MKFEQIFWEYDIESVVRFNKELLTVYDLSYILIDFQAGGIWGIHLEYLSNCYWYHSIIMIFHSILNVIYLMDTYF